MTSPAAQREKILRDALQQVQNVWFTYWSRPIEVVVEALAAADAIPDAPAIDQSLTGVYQVSAIATKPVPSRAELIELMRSTYVASAADSFAGTAAEVLDALIKVGAVKL